MIMRTTTLGLLLVTTSALVAFACGPAAPAASVEPRFAEVAAIHHSKCGACHKRVEPGQRTRAQLEEALKPHRRRVPMSEENWALLVDYLAADTAPSPPPR